MKNQLEDMRAYQMHSYDLQSRENRIKKPMSKVVAFLIVTTIIAIGYGVSLQYANFMNTKTNTFIYVY